MDKCREAFEKWICQQDWFYDYMGNRTKDEILSFDDKDGNYHFLTQQKCWEAWQSRQAEVDQLNEAIERQGKLAIQAMNEAHKGSRLELSIAKDIQASLKPELIESERQMNAQLTDENMKLEARIDVACKSINSFFDNQVSTPTPREYANFIAEILEVLRGEHDA